MNRLILKYGYLITVVILLIFVWVVYQRITTGSGILVLAVTAAILWVLGTVAFILFWPRMIIGGFKRAFTRRGFSGGPIPVNTLYAEPSTSSQASSSSVLGTGTDHLLYVAGWLDLRRGPQVLHVPDMTGRYYSVQFTEPSGSTNFAYVGTRATGSDAGDYLLTGPGWTGSVPGGMTRIPSTSKGVLVVGRVYLGGEDDQPAAYALAQRIQVRPLIP